LRSTWRKPYGAGALAQVWLGLAEVGIPAVLLMARLAWR